MPDRLGSTRPSQFTRLVRRGTHSRITCSLRRPVQFKHPGELHQQCATLQNLDTRQTLPVMTSDAESRERRCRVVTMMAPIGRSPGRKLPEVDVTYARNANAVRTFPGTRSGRRWRTKNGRYLGHFGKRTS